MYLPLKELKTKELFLSYSRYSNTRSRGPWGMIVFGLTMFIIGALVGGVIGVFVFIRITGGTGEASEPISAPTLSLDNAAQATEAIVSPTEVSATAVSVVPTDIPTTEVEAVAVAPSETSVAARLFRIVPQESEARFSVYETFPEGTAIGRTNQIAGDIIVDFNAPSNSQIGTIRINLRTLRTDDPDRDSSIRCCVLLTAQDIYEFSDFVPTAITGMPEQVQVGIPITFQVTGDLTLRGTTRPVTFDVVVTPNSLTEISGTATTTVNRSDFGILNDDRNGFDYHGVEEQVNLAFDFVAREVES